MICRPARLRALRGHRARASALAYEHSGFRIASNARKIFSEMVAGSATLIVSWVGAAQQLRHRNSQLPRARLLDRVCEGKFNGAAVTAAHRLPAMFSQSYLSACLCFKNAANY